MSESEYTIKEVLFIIFILILAIAVAVTSSIDEYGKAKTALKICKDNGWKGINDIGNPLSAKYRCYNGTDGFITYSDEVMTDLNK